MSRISRSAAGSRSATRYMLELATVPRLVWILVIAILVIVLIRLIVGLLRV